MKNQIKLIQTKATWSFDLGGIDVNYKDYGLLILDDKENFQIFINNKITRKYNINSNPYSVWNLKYATTKYFDIIG